MIRIKWWGPCGTPPVNETSLRLQRKPGSHVMRCRSEAKPCERKPASLAATVSETVQHEIILLERIGRQDGEALAELYDRFAPILFGLAYRMLSQEAEAEDVLQDVFLKVWEKAVVYDARLGTPVAWLITLTRNRATDRLRSVTRRSRILELLRLDDEAIHRTEAASPSRSAITQETALAMQEALKHLPHEQRQAIELAFLGGLSQSEIAAELNEPLGTIKARIRRGMLNLRQHLPPEWQSTEQSSGLGAESQPSGLDQAK